MHAQPSKWFDVSVAMVDCVDVLVQGADVDKPGRAGVTVCWSFSDIIGFSGKQQLESPVRKVEVNTTKERNKEERENEDGDVGKAWNHLLVVEEGKTTSGVAMKKDRLPSCVLNHSQKGVKHVVKHLVFQEENKVYCSYVECVFCLVNLCKSNKALGVEGSTWPAKYVKGATPEAIIAKGDDKVDPES